MAKLSKIIAYLVLSAAMAFVAFLVVGFSFFSYNKKTIIDGCVQEFCIEHSKDEAVELFQTRYSFDSGALVPFDPSIVPDKFESTNHANSIEEMITQNRWTIIYPEERGWEKFIHLSFEGETISQIEIIKYGPFYLDP